MIRHTVKAGLGVMVAAAAIIVAAAAPAGARGAAQCGTVAFAPQSDNGAFQITARSASCGTARGVAEASRPSRFRYGNPSYAAEGFACSGRSEQLGGAGKQVVRFQCANHHSSVSFLRG